MASFKVETRQCTYFTYCREEAALSSESDDELEMSVIGKHDIVVKQEGKLSTGFFKSMRKQHPMFPFYEEKIKCDEYGEIIRPEDYKLAEAPTEFESNKENAQVTEEESTGVINNN